MWAKASEHCVCEARLPVLYPRNQSSDVVHVFALLVATLSGATPSPLSALQQEALCIPRSALSELEPIGEGVVVKH